MPYVMGDRGDIVAILWADHNPLHAPPLAKANKILWVVRTPRQGSQLVVDGHPLGGTEPQVHLTQPANSGPGEIYPSIVDVPSAGCWQFDLQWAHSHVQVELNYI